MKRRILFFAAAILFLPLVVWGREVATDNVYVAKDAVINDNLVRAGQTITIDGVVHGDVMVAGLDVTINGTVDGDVIAAAQTIRILGSVAGNIRAAGTTIELGGTISKNATVFGNNIDVRDTATVGWSLQAFGTSITLAGTVHGNVNYYGTQATARADIKGNAFFNLGKEGSLRILPPAKIGNNLTYESTQSAVIDPDVTIGGHTQQNLPTVVDRGFREMFGTFKFYLRFVGLFGMLVIGLVLLSLIPKSARAITAMMQQKVGWSVLWGALVLVVTPVVAFLLLFTIIGIPLAFISITLYAILLCVTKIFVGLFLGTWILEKLRKGSNAPLLWSMIIGVVIYSLLTWIPILGWFIGLFGMLWALGAMVAVKWKLIRDNER